MHLIIFGVLTAFATLTNAGEYHETTTRKIIQIVHSETVQRPDGSYDFAYQGEDGTNREESSVVNNPGTEDESTDIHGSYKYIDADGKEVEVHYTAGKNGFVPYGTNIREEISANAKAAADLPSHDYDEDDKPFSRKLKDAPQQYKPQFDHIE